MSVLGEQIKKYRMEKGITQEQLGQMIGVTTQGVSRWERGGTPDAELLPKLAEVLGVSIDALFGREEKSLALTLARQLAQLPPKKAHQYAFNICWAILLGLIGDLSVFDDFMNRMIEYSEPMNDRKGDYFARILHDSGMAHLRMSPDLGYFFFMQEPQGCLKDQLEDRESLRQVFELFADKKLLEIVFFLHTVCMKPMDTSLISQHTGIDLAETDRCMERLCACNLATRSVIATADGDINAYVLRREHFAIPLLCFADEIAKKDLRSFMGEFKREKPFF